MQNNIIYYHIGSSVIRLSAPPFSESENLAVFRCSPTPADESFTVTFTRQIAPPDSPVLFGNGYPNYHADGIRTMRDQVGGGILFKDTVAGNEHTVEFLAERADAFGTMMVLHIFNLADMALHKGGLILHASYIEVNGKAVLFTAPKQVGKSTQAALWEQHRGAAVVNGDRALILPTATGFNACGSPYCGTSKICRNRTLPLKAIVILSQAAQNSARPATAHEAVYALLNGATYNTTDIQSVHCVAEAANRIIASVPILRLACTPDIGAIEALEAIL